MNNIYLLQIILYLVVSVYSLNSKNDSKSLDVVELAETESNNEDNNNESLWKRDSGYYYKRPERLNPQRSRFVYREKYRTSRLPSSTRLVKPFNTYGAPTKQYTLNYNLKQKQQQQQQQQLLQHVNQNHNQFQTENNNKYPSTGGKFPLEVPSLNTDIDCVQSNPIASQNDIPFQNSANYLPPKNQKLPSLQLTMFRPRMNNQFINNNNNLMSQNIINNQPNSQISDAQQFLINHSQAISKLYETPATNVNYEPVHDDSQIDFKNQFRNLDSTSTLMQTPQHQQHLEDMQNSNNQFPSYSSGLLDSYRSLEQIHLMRREKLLARIQQILEQNRQSNQQDQSRYEQNINDKYSDNLKTVSSLSLQTSLDNSKMMNHHNGLDNSQLPNVISSSSSLPSPSPSTTFQTNNNDKPQNSPGGASNPASWSGTSVAFPQYIPANLPTHFNIPIPDNKPTFGLAPNPVISAKPSIISISPFLPVLPPPSPPVLPPPLPPPSSIVPVVPVASVPFQTIPASSATQVQSSIHYKKLYPIFYPNKPLLPTHPWSYAPNSSPTTQNW